MGFAARAGLLCVVALSTIGANAEPSRLARLLERMRAAAGPVWQGHFVSVSRLQIGTEQHVVFSESAGLRITVRRCTGELCSGSYFDGEHLYSVNMNGTALAAALEPQPFLRSLRLVASLEFLAPGFSAHGGRIADAGDANLHGKPYRTIVVADVNAVPLRLYVDASGLVRLARELGGNESFEYTDYRRTAGFALPFEVLHDGRPFERYDDRTAVSSPFAPPRGLVPTFHGAPQTIATDARSATPIVDCTLAGIAAHCLIDTGNSGISISSELASRLDAPVAGTYQVLGLGGYSTQVVRAGPLVVGNATFPPAYYAVLDDVRRYGYDVVLGADALAATGITIDGSAHAVRLSASLDRTPIAVPLTFENFVPVVTVAIGNVQTSLAVDTGDESNINLAYDFYAKHPGIFNVTQRRFVSGIGGNSVEMIGEVPQVTIGEYRTGPQRIGTTQLLRGTAFGHLGAGFLTQFVVELNYAAAELRLIPRT